VPGRTTSRAYLETPDPGKAGEARKQLDVSINKPLPGAGRPKPKPRPPPKPSLPKCKTLYNYEAQDTDELSFVQGEEIEIVKEDSSGWWVGRVRGKDGLFPSNYVEKL